MKSGGKCNTGENNDNEAMEFTWRYCVFDFKQKHSEGDILQISDR